jgi:SecD/SecF fusion protein
MKKSTIQILCILLIIAAAAGAIWKFPINLGLDLKGGIDVILQAEDTPTHKVTSDDVDKAKTAIERRIDQLGVAEPLVVRQGVRRIRVQLPGIEDQDKAFEIIGKTAQLTFKDPSGKIILTGSDLKNATAGFGGQLNSAVVNLEFSAEGKAKFSEATTRLAMLPDREQRVIAMYLDKELISAPAVQYGEPITNGNAQITGIGDIEKAKEISVMLRAGSLPVPVKVVSHSFVDPLLGQESIDKSIKAGAVGLVLVLLFMLIYYRIPGLIADLALSIYCVLTLALLALLHATLTLPGIAGFILSIGMAVDANVIIFERMKEEMQAGKNLRAAIHAAYTRAWAAILDSNITTLITGAVLFFYGTGSIKGFAVTLVLGIAAHLFTAIVITRMIINLFVDRNPEGLVKYFKVVDFSPTGWNIVGQRKFWMALSLIMLVLGLSVWGAKGLNKGIDFQSGTIMQVRFLDKKPTVGNIEEVLSSIKLKNVDLSDNVIQPSENKFIIRTQELQPRQADQVFASLEKEFGRVKNLGTDTVGPVIGKELTHKAVIAVILSSIGILIYMAFRFEFKSAVAAVIALLHDVGMLIGIFALLHRQVDSSFVAAILTVLGYSVSDTIVVFDRIRENLRLRKKETFEELSKTVFSGRMPEKETEES